MTTEAKLNALQSYVNARMDLHGDWWGKLNAKEIFEELQTELKELNEQIVVDKELMQELIDNKILRSEVHKDIEKVWMFDSSFSLTPDEDIKERTELIEKVFYKIANEWID